MTESTPAVSTQTDLWDVIVVGAGPAGCTAAIYAARAGLRTLLLEAKSAGKDKICGDAVAGKCIPILRELGVLDEIANGPHGYSTGVLFSSPRGDQVRITFNPPGAKHRTDGYIVRRKVFDDVLLRRARSEPGVTLRTGFKVDDVVYGPDGAVTGVAGRTTGTEEAPVVHAARLVIGADGYRSAVARATGRFEKHPRHWVSALRQYWTGVQGMGEHIEVHFVDVVIPGYLWIFPLEDGKANVGLGMLDHDIERRGIDLRQHLNLALQTPFFRDRFASATPLERPVQWELPLASRRRVMYGNGFLLAGDAAGLIDPFTGEGVGAAMHSGKMAAIRAAEALGAGNVSESFLKVYDDRYWSYLGGEVRLSHKLQRIGRHKWLLNWVLGRAARNEAIRDMISGMLANVIPKKDLASPAFFWKVLRG